MKILLFFNFIFGKNLLHISFQYVHTPLTPHQPNVLHQNYQATY